ncbi:MAG: gluconate 2-dehydrogenase subunit 3 family protein [Opitutaceae bacterium]
MNPTPLSDRLDRRAAIKWMLAGTATMMVIDRATFAQGAATPGGKGYGTDPDLIKEYKPGDLWPLTLNDHQRRTATVLCAVIIPADDRSPSAADLHVQDFVDEWISAPYPGHDADRTRILAGLAWLDTEAKKRFGKDFADLAANQHTAICDDICRETPSRAEFKEPSLFFKRFRDLTAGGFYTTKEGMKDINYVGNVPLVTFDGPPPEVLKKLGLA